MQKIVQVHMLPTDAPTHNGIWIDHVYRKLFIHNGITKSQKPNIPQHLYFTSEEEVKEGDWLIVGNVRQSNHRIEKAIAENLQSINSVKKSMEKMKSTSEYVICKKIIASTNPELYQCNGYDLKYLPVGKIPLQFIKEYVEKQGNIKEVKLEYEDKGEEEWMGDDYNGQPFWNPNIVLNLDSQGCVIVSPMEHTWGTLWTAWCRYQDINKVKYIGQFLEWMEHNYNPPIPK